MANESGEKGKLGCAIAIVAVLLPLLLAVIMLIVNNKPPSVTIPTHSVPKDNGWDYFVRAGHMLGMPGPVSSTKDEGKWTDADYEAFMKSNAAALAELRRGLAKPCVCPPRRDPNGFPEYTHVRELARLLRSEAMYYERKGEYGTAVDSQLDCLEMGASQPRGGGLIADMVGDAMVAIGSKKIEGNLARLDASDLAREAEHIERVRKKIVPYSAVVLEAGLELASVWIETFCHPETEIRSMMLNPLKWADLGEAFPGSSTMSGTSNFFTGARLAFASKTRLVEQMLDYFRAVAVECRKPYTGTSAVPKPQSPLLDYFLPDIAHQGRRQHLRAETTIALIQTELALRRFNADQKHYPARLDELIPRYLKAVPIDPFGIGKPLRYKSLNGGKSFLLYSVGGNMTDDGGKPSPHRGDWTEGDLLLSGT